MKLAKVPDKEKEYLEEWVKGGLTGETEITRPSPGDLTTYILGFLKTRKQLFWQYVRI